MNGEKKEKETKEREEKKDVQKEPKEEALFPPVKRDLPVKRPLAGLGVVVWVAMMALVIYIRVQSYDHNRQHGRPPTKSEDRGQINRPVTRPYSPPSPTHSTYPTPTQPPTYSPPQQKLGPVVNDPEISRRLMNGEKYEFTVRPGEDSSLVFNHQCGIDWWLNGPICLKWSGGEDCMAPREFQNQTKHSWNPQGEYRVTPYSSWGKAVRVRPVYTGCQ